MRDELPIACSLLTPPFFRFQLDFQPGGGEILLRVTGPEGTKQFLSEAFSLASSP